MIFRNGQFYPQGARDKRVEDVLYKAIDLATDRVRSSDFLAAALALGDARVASILAQALQPGSSTSELLELIQLLRRRASPISDFDGKENRFTPQALAALEDLSSGLERGGEAVRGVALELLLAAALSHPEPEEAKALRILDGARGSELLRLLVKAETEPLTPLFDGLTGRLRSEELTETAWTVLESACVKAAEIGYDRLLPPHIFLALLGETEGVLEHLVRLQTAPDLGPGKVSEIVAAAFRQGEGKRDPLDLTLEGLGEAAVELLRTAQKTARVWGADQIETSHLAVGLLEHMPARLSAVLHGSPLKLDLGRMRQHLDQLLQESRQKGRRETPFRLPTGLLPSEDLTFRARRGELLPGLHLAPHVDAITRALYRQSRHHVLVIGDRGVGKTTLLKELARQAAQGELPFLKRKRFLWVDSRNIAPEDSRSRLAQVLAHVSGRTDLILCLDGLGPLLRAPSGGNNKVLLRAAMGEGRVQLVAVLSRSDFDELFQGDADLLEPFTVIRMAEPPLKAAMDMVEQAAREMGKEYKLDIESQAIERAVVLSSHYILSQRLPVKAIKVLRQVCEDLDYERTQQGGKTRSAGPADVIRVLSESSGIPASTLSGVGEEADYDSDLRAEVVGQDSAVAQVSMELRRIKSGLNALSDGNKPASVMLFSGLTGVGKTELAKAVARLYSSSKLLQTYTMGNFSEPHSISGIIGSPQGYHGHEQGGRLINDLNADPYCVFLLDEGEKAHPEVWKPFLNLFDEGWVVDQRGVKAFGERAIFIITSNAGHEVISEMARQRQPMDRIVEAVKAHLLKLKHERTQEPVFRPEFLARIKRIIIFEPLTPEAMVGICRKFVHRMQFNWQQSLGKKLIVPEGLIRHVAARSHQINKQHGDTEGARIVGKLMSELIEESIQAESRRQPKEYEESNVVELLLQDSSHPQMGAVTPRVEVRLRRDPPPPPGQSLLEAAAELRSALARGTTSPPGGVSQAIAACLSRLEAKLESWKRRGGGELSGPDCASLERLRVACEIIQDQSRRLETDARSALEDVLRSLDTARGEAS